MNTKFFVIDIVFLIAFILQGMETHDSDSSFIEISLPYISAIIIIMTILYRIGFIQINEEHEHVKSLRVWMAVILLGTMIRFIMNDNFAAIHFGKSPPLPTVISIKVSPRLATESINILFTNKL